MLQVDDFSSLLVKSGRLLCLRVYLQLTLIVANSGTSRDIPPYSPGRKHAARTLGQVAFAG